jgi:predicted transcriptional regulator
MAETTTITVRIPIGIRDRLDRIAQLTDRSRSYVAADALAAFANNELDVLEGIMRGLEDVRAGRTIPHDEAMASLRKRIGAVEARNKKRSA